MTNAVIYLRGHNQDVQEKKCRDYAKEKGYHIIGVTTDINGDLVQKDNVLLIAHYSRISRNIETFHKILNELEYKGVRLESVVGKNNTNLLELLNLYR